VECIILSGPTTGNKVGAGRFDLAEGDQAGLLLVLWQQVDICHILDKEGERK
jgi:hypothetical protein